MEPGTPGAGRAPALWGRQLGLGPAPALVPAPWGREGCSGRGAPSPNCPNPVPIPVPGHGRSSSDGNALPLAGGHERPPGLAGQCQLSVPMGWGGTDPEGARGAHLEQTPSLARRRQPPVSAPPPRRCSPRSRRSPPAPVTWAAISPRCRGALWVGGGHPPRGEARLRPPHTAWHMGRGWGLGVSPPPPGSSRGGSLHVPCAGCWLLVPGGLPDMCVCV